MEGLLTLLLFAGFFYLMMRIGCGAHSGHGSHGDPEGAHKDPVCGMNVKLDQGYGKSHAGREYRFCSRNCLDKFDADPEQYLEPTGGMA